MQSATSVTRRHSAAAKAGQRGFSLVEMLVVLALIGMVTALIGPQVVGYLGGAKEDSAKAEIANLETSLDLYKLDVGRYPNDREGLQALVAQPSGVDRWHGPYLQHADLPADPWGHPYVYRTPGHKAAYDLYTRGPDGDRGDPADTHMSRLDPAGSNDSRAE